MPECESCNTEMELVGKCYCDRCNNTRFQASRDKKTVRCTNCWKVFTVGDLPTRLH